MKPMKIQSLFAFCMILLFALVVKVLRTSSSILPLQESH